MQRTPFLSSLITAFIASCFCVGAFAQEANTSSSTTTTVTETPTGTVTKEVKTEIITPVPAAKEVIVAPQGYTNCFTVAAGWYNNLWVPAHQVCQYEKSNLGVVWIEGYWACNKATSAGVCSNWEWRAGHWEKKLTVY